MARVVIAKGSEIFRVDKMTINGIEDAIRWAEIEAPARIAKGANELARSMATVNLMFARKMSAGPSDPGERFPEQAWRIPVRRISGRYYLSWRVMGIRRGVWALVNDSREAYFIEFGISRVGFGGERHVPARRIRRPIRKMSLRKTLHYMMSTRAYHRVWAEMMTSPRARHRGKGFTQHVQAPGGGHSMFAPWGSRAANPGSGAMTGPGVGRQIP